MFHSFIHSFTLVRKIIPEIHTNNKPVHEGKIKRESYGYSRIFSLNRREREEEKGGTNLKWLYLSIQGRLLIRQRIKQKRPVIKQKREQNEQKEGGGKCTCAWETFFDLHNVGPN